MKPHNLPFEQLLTKMQHWCATDERCTMDVMRKLKELGASLTDTKTIADRLTDDNFINDERFASLYVRSKFNIRHWGRRRLEMELRQRHIASDIIRQSLSEIEEPAYRGMLAKLADQKAKQIDGDDFAIKQKVFRYLIQKGYEPDLIGLTLRTAPEDIAFNDDE